LRLFALKFFTVLNILFTFRTFEELALALKHRVCPKVTVCNIYFLSFRIVEHLALALKTEFALKFFKPGGYHPPPASYNYVRHYCLWVADSPCLNYLVRI